MPEGQKLAIVGVSFRFPGANGDGFWQALCEGRNLVTSVHESRWSKQAYQHPRDSEPGRSYTFAAGSLGDVSGFDAGFFGISPREAAQIDPQQRLLLELAWEALESGGIRPSSLRGSRSGVLIGFSGSDYLYRHADDPSSLDAFVMTGCTGSVAANRVSYHLDLRGPSMSVDTACSSALTSFHLACQSLKTGECDLALAGAVNLHLHPLPFIAFSKATMLSRTGASRAFDAAGDGYVRSEGGAILVLKRLKDAVAAGNRIFAVVAGSAVNCDGRTNGLTVPSAEAQAALLADVYKRAGIEPRELAYVEAHGTGTAVGDPIEARALGEALGQHRPQGEPLPIGSVKTNVGHLEAAAGMAGLIKAIYCLRHRMVPRSLHFETPNPRIPFGELNLEVVAQPRPLSHGGRLVIGVNSFGFGGANGHAILESAPPPAPRAAPVREDSAPLVVSARSEPALREAARSMARWLRERDDLALHDIATSAALHRDWHEHRAVMFTADRRAAAQALETFAAQGSPTGLATGRALPQASAPVFVYSGNGSQWAGMGRRLLDEEPVFREAVAAIDRAFRAHSERSLLAMLRDDNVAQLLEATETAQPLLFAVQVGLTELLRTWGISPAACLGHSVGEIAAAWASGALSLGDAVRIVFHRSAWQGTTRGAGVMCAVRAGGPEMRELLATQEAGSRIAVAGINSARSITLAGPLADIEALEAELRRRSISFTRLALDYAFHSNAMNPIETGVFASLGGLRPTASRIPFYSTVTGGLLEGEALGTGYWWRNIREPVRFEAAFKSLVATGATVFVEVGPRPILGGYMGECLGEALRRNRIVATLAPGADDAQALRKRAGELLIAGSPIDVARFFKASAPYVDLPGYPWQRERHWYDPTPESLGMLGRRMVHPLLGYRLPGHGAAWEARLDASILPACADHRVGGEIVFPAAGFVEAALAACAELREGTLREIENLVIHAPLILAEGRSKTVRLTVDPEDGRFVIRGRDTASDGDWRVHVTGRVPMYAAAPSPIADFTPPGAAPGANGEAHYERLGAAGLQYGPAFRAVAQVWREPEGAAALLSSPASLLGEDGQAQLEPGALDACFQLLAHVRDEAATMLLPVRVGRLCVLRPGEAARYARVRTVQKGARSAVIECFLYGEDRKPIAVAYGVRLRALPRDSQLALLQSRAVPMPLAGSVREAPLPSTEQLRAACLTRLHAEPRLAARRRYFEILEPLLEAMLAAFAHETLSRGPIAGISPERLELLRRIAGDGDLPPAAEIFTELIADHPDHAGEILQLGRIGTRLAELACGKLEIEPLASDTSAFEDALADLVGDAARSLPAARRLRVLVLEPESGGIATRIAASIDPGTTDVHSAVAPNALGDEKPFDIALVDARAAAAAPEQALRDLRGRLRAGAVAALLEPIPGRSSALAAEILQLEDTGAGYGAAPRERAVLVAEWYAALERCGFDVQAQLDDLPGVHYGAFLLLARARREEAAQTEAAAQPAGVWLLAAGASSESTELATRLRAELLQRGQTVEILERAAPGAQRWAQTLAQARARHSAIAGVVDLQLSGPRQSQAPRDVIDRQVARCESLGALLEACSAEGTGPDCWLVTAQAASALLPPDASDTRGAGGPRSEEAALWGFARSAANEYPALALRRLDLAAPEALRPSAALLAEALLNPDDEDEAILTLAGRYVVRIESELPARGRGTRETVSLETGAPGLMRHLGWVRRALPVPGEDEVEIDVRAAGLNFRDVMYAMGQLTDEALESGFAGATLGMELSGVVTAVGPGVRNLSAGDRVIAFAASSFGTRVITRAPSVLKMPASWSFEAGATIPTAFLTAHYALNQLARLHEGERVLIHGAAGGVGIAAIQIARNAGAEIFATAGSDAKRDIVRLLGVDHVLNSRSLDFAPAVLDLTGGRGVDVVLNSLAGEAMIRSIQVLRPLGRFLELGKRDYYEDSRLGLRPFRNNISYFGIDADQLMRERPAFVRRMMQDLLGMFEEGSLSPLPFRAFPAADAVEAFRYMQQSRHIGKIVLRMDPPPRAQATAPGRRAPLALPERGTYLVTGGLGGFGMRTAQWLAERGARHLVLVGRSAPGEAAAAEIALLRARGIEVRTERCDITDFGALQALFSTIRAQMPPLRGVVHAAAVIRDGLVRGLERGQIEEVLAPKVLGALNLHRLTRDLHLDFFVFYSSATTVFGSPGQAAYVAGNSFLEALAAERRARRLPALCVAWGPIGDAGYLARNPEVRERLVARMGVGALDAAQALDTLEQLLVEDASGAALLRAGRGALGRLAAATRAPRFRPLATSGDPTASASAEGDELERWLAELDDTALAALLADRLKAEAAEILRLPADRLDASQPLQELGFDSLMGVELITAIEARFGVAIPALAISEIGTLERLAMRLAQELRRGASAGAADRGAALSQQAQRLAAQHTTELSPEEVEAVAAGVRKPAAGPEPRIAARGDD